MSGVSPRRLTSASVTRSTEATQSGAAAMVARRRRSAPNGVWGMVLFLCSEITIFGTLMATYFYLDFDARQWPPPGVEKPTISWPAIATGWLVLTSIPMWMASRAARRGARGSVLALISFAWIAQGVYLAAQIILFRHDLNDFSPQNTAYGSIYFTLLAAHHAHVLLGLLLDGVVLAYVTLRGLTNYWLTAVRGVAIYWHVVNVLAILVLLTQISPSL